MEVDCETSTTESTPGVGPLMPLDIISSELSFALYDILYKITG